MSSYLLYYEFGGIIYVKHIDIINYLIVYFLLCLLIISLDWADLINSKHRLHT